MLEAFFTRQRQRNIFVLLTAITGLIWGGTQTIIVTQLPPQASQTTSEVATTTDAAATTNSRTLKPAQPIEVTPTPESSPAPQAAATATQATPSTTPAVLVTAGRTERVETTDAISYVLHFNVTLPADTVPNTITTKVTTDVGCMEPATAPFTSTSQVVTCTVLKSALQTAPDQLNFKLDVLNDATSFGQLSFVVAK